jgi:ATP-binding cassette, subfamily B, bacterial
VSTTRKTVAIFWRETKRYPWRFLASLVLWPAGIALQDMGLPFVAALTINHLVALSQTHQPIVWAPFVPYLVAFVIVGIFGQLLIYLALRNMIFMQATVRENLHNKTYQHLLGHSMHFHANSFSGALVSQASRFANAYVAISDIVMNQSLNVLTKFVVAIIVLMVFSPPIALALFVWTIIFAYINITLTRRRMPLTRAAMAAETALTAHLADSTSNVAAIKSFAREEDESASFAAKARDRKVKTMRTWGKAIRNGSMTALMMTGIQLIVLIVSIYAMIRGEVQIGTLLLAQVYVNSLIGSLWNLGSLTRGLEQNFSDAAEMTEILYQDQDIKDDPAATQLVVTKGEIHLDHIDFSHADSDGEVLFANFDLTLHPGEKVGLVGHSGSGKTTLTRLLLRFADVNKGSINIDGQNIGKVKQADLRDKIAYVPQEPLLFHRSVHENIAYGKPDATRNEVMAAATLAHAAEFIDKLPKGYDTLVGERGVKLSGGQRQRIAIARAILKNAPIIILDEATSALDSESEKLIQDALKKLMQGRTTLVIAHRLSTIQTMDRIVVLEEGRIIEAGSHAQLLARGGVYAELWKHQSGGFIEE